MKLDRSLFFFLTSTMAGAACASRPGAPPDAPEVAIEIPVVQPHASASAEPPKPPAPQAEAVAVDPSSEGGEDGPEYGADEGGGACGMGNASFNFTKRGCTDTAGVPLACPASPSCGTFPQAKCNSYRTKLKAKIAERAVVCARTVITSGGCDSCALYRCGHEALMTACPDPTANAECTAITRACPQTSATECLSYLSGMNATGRRAMVTCMQGACGYGLYSCLESI